MPAHFRRLLPLLFLSAATAAVAQREGGGPPADDPFQRPEAPVSSIGNYQSHALQGKVLTIRTTTGATVRVQPWFAPGAGFSGEAYRVDFYPSGSPAPRDSSISLRLQRPITAFSSAPGRGQAITQQPKLQQSAASLRVNPQPLGGLLEVLVQKSPLRISFMRGADTLLADAGGLYTRQANFATATGGAGVSFRLNPTEHLYGTGSRALPVDRRGRKLTLYNVAHYAYQNGDPQLNTNLPVVLSSRGYGLFFDNHAPGTFDLGATEPNVLRYDGEGLENLTYYLLVGEAPRPNQGSADVESQPFQQVLEAYTTLTGTQPLPPRWALGLIQSRFGYRTEAETEGIARKMRAGGFPIDGVVLDLYWFGGTKRQGDFAWDAPNFPNPMRMMRRLDSAGVKTILISEPYVMRTSRNDALVRSRGLVGRDQKGQPYTVESFWAGPATLLDMFRPATRQWMWEQYDRLKRDGVGGWWFDLGEPENQPFDMVYDGGTTRQIHNAYGQAWASILSENHYAKYPNERLFLLARSGWAGMQRHSVFPWSGDINRSWSGYQAQVPIMLGMGLSGVGYMHSDAGGFCVGPYDAELYTRWLQHSALSPILRPHGEGVPPEPVYYPEPYQSIVRRYVRLRYSLLPYLYTLAHDNTITGAPLARPMNYEHPTDERLANLNDQYLLGRDLLVAPVTQPGQRRRNVVLPTGTWADYHTGTPVRGGQTIGASAPLGDIPLLVRAGALLPMAQVGPNTTQAPTDTLYVRYYAAPGVKYSESKLYEDDGKNAQALAAEQYRRWALRANNTGTELQLTLGTELYPGKGYPNEPARRTVQWWIPRVAAAPTAATLNGQPLASSAWQYDAATRTLRINTLQQRGQNVELALRGVRLLPTETAQPDRSPVAFTLGAVADRSTNSGTEVQYQVHTPGQYAVQVRNAAGQVVRTLFADGTKPGERTLRWDTQNDQKQQVPAGVYYFEAQGQRQRILVMR
ncbi:TIM-barrel domain-containing protein [Solirubrum puertoriconensis]|uniref:Glycosyl hydrolase n=1 Tax=Solirubrum puertoriconensis TaxID=1751427 RepID=A0A9X0HJD9_SOLP1|nr:TIM-barrel domain-containing protein [Solirubrum puertoriconensis]KUG06959.1 hypothetical protein ASU33_06445 [Solirubrum puertoriconensis]